jgi:hypothetical protein
MSFCTVVNCIDGRVQVPVIEYLCKRFDVQFVDSVTEPGVDLLLGDQQDAEAVRSVLDKISISVEKHQSVGIAIAGHYDCAKNPVSEQEHLRQIMKSVEFLSSQYGDLPVIGLWVDAEWTVRELNI